MPPKQPVPVEQYAGWNIFQVNDGELRATLERGARTEAISVKFSPRDADVRVMTRMLMQKIDEANDRMQTGHWKDWAKARDREIKDAREEGRAPLLIPYDDMPIVGRG